MRRTPCQELPVCINIRLRLPSAWDGRALSKSSKAGAERRPVRLVERQSPRRVFGLCAAYSEKTVCCGLRTIDAGVSWAVVQTVGNQVTGLDLDQFVLQAGSKALEGDGILAQLLDCCAGGIHLFAMLVKGLLVARQLRLGGGMGLAAVPPMRRAAVAPRPRAGGPGPANAPTAAWRGPVRAP